MSDTTKNVKACIVLTGNECRTLFRKLHKESTTEEILPENFNIKDFKNIVQVMKSVGFSVEVNRHQRKIIINGYEGKNAEQAQSFISWIASEVKDVGYMVWKDTAGVLSQLISQSNIINYAFDVTEQKEKVSVVHMELKTSGSKSHTARDNFLNTITALKREGKTITWNLKRTESADLYDDFEADLDVVSMTRLRNSINSVA